MTQIFTDITAWYMANMNYYTIGLLMMIESTFIPLPSEIVVPPAAFKAAQGDLNIYLVVISATVGALMGALFNYFVSLWVGRAAIYALAETRLARMCMIKPASIEKAENYFVTNGKSSTFIGRLVPGIRHLISVPAGLAKMPIKSFILYTVIGAGMWNIILALIGYFIPQEMVETYFKEISMAMLILGALFGMFLLYKGFFQKKKEN